MDYPIVLAFLILGGALVLWLLDRLIDLFND